jgi:hypothetical protein
VSRTGAEPRALAYGLARYQADAAGKTLLVGWRGDSALFAIAAGLGGAADRDNFAVLARYLLRRDGADGYWLLLSADLDAQEHLAAETVAGKRRRLTAAPLQRDAAGSCVALGPAVELGGEAPLGDLLDGGDSLPGLMRRELDRLARRLAVTMP